MQSWPRSMSGVPTGWYLFRWLLRIKWEGSLYVDTTLPFGLRSAPKIFSAIVDAVEWIVKQAGVRFVIHYLDDFLLIETPDTDECEKGVRTLLEVFHRLGLPVAEGKLEGPDVRLTFLGFEVDSCAMELRLPEDKLNRSSRGGRAGNHVCVMN